MLRLLGQRLILFPGVLLGTNALAFAFVDIARRAQSLRNPFLASHESDTAGLAAYPQFLGRWLRLDLGTMPAGQQPVAEALRGAAAASLALLGISLAVGLVAGLALGMAAVRSHPPRVAGWLTWISTIGLSSPSFFIGTLFILGVILLAGGRGSASTFLTVGGFGWDQHLILPVLTLGLRPAAQIGQTTAALLAAELGQRHILTARTLGVPEHSLRWRHGLRTAAAPVILSAAGTLRMLCGELLVVETLFDWPGLGRLLAQTLIPSHLTSAAAPDLFLHPVVLPTVLTLAAVLFFGLDTLTTATVRWLDPRTRDQR